MGIGFGEKLERDLVFPLLLIVLKAAWRSKGFKLDADCGPGTFKIIGLALNWAWASFNKG